MLIRQHMERVAELRRKIHSAESNVSDAALRTLWHEAQSALNNVRVYGDLILVSFFDKKQPKERETRRLEFAASVLDSNFNKHVDRIIKLRYADPPLSSFHWEIEFPEVFERNHSGFDLIVGNPPFAGKNTLAASNLLNYPDWLKNIHSESHGNSDLVAHFFRRAFDLIRVNGTFGLIATNTIAQGDTRSTGLRWICNHNGDIYHAVRRFKWPGMAAVVVNTINVKKGLYSHTKYLDSNKVQLINAFLFHVGGNEDPIALKSNRDKSFVGSIVLGMGFTFDDVDDSSMANSLDKMQDLISKDLHNQDIIFPYIGGEDLTSSPTHKHRRYVINFKDFPLRREDLSCSWSEANVTQQRTWIGKGVVPQDYPDPVASDWPELLEVVEKNVRPERLANNRKRYRSLWWQFGEIRPGLYSTITGLGRVLSIVYTSKFPAFVFLNNEMIFDQSLIVFPLDLFASFCTLQSNVHEIWARFFGATLEDRFRYNPSDCFETFPFPRDWETHPSLEAVGKAYYEFRAELMVSHNEGLTKTYNRFHNPNEDDPRILRLRELHADMDRAVLDAYGWTDIPTECEFLLDYEIDEEEWGKKKKPWRYRWPDHVRDEVLGRLLELNAQRAAEEKRSGAAAKKPSQRPKRSPRRASDKSPSLFP